MRFLCRLLALWALTHFLLACQTTPSSNMAPGANASTTPVTRTKEFPWMSVSRWYEMHSEDVALAQRNDIELLFVGDSITESWDWGEGRDEVYQRYFGDFEAANFAIGGDMTQNLLWRLQHNLRGNLAPTAVVMMIGVNNFLHEQHSPAQVIKGIQADLAQVHDNYPTAKVLMIGVLPFRQNGDHPSRQHVRQVNHAAAKMADNQKVFFIDVNSEFLDQQGDIPQALMADYIHPTAAGLEIIAKKIAPIINQWIMQARAETQKVTASDANINIMGRSATTETQARILAYPGVSLKLRTNAQRVSMHAQSQYGNSYVEVQIDDQPAQAIQLPKQAQDIVLVSNNTQNTSHDILIRNRSETWNGISTIDYFTLQHGSLLELAPLPKRKILIVGDSISCGEAAARPLHMSHTNCKKDESWWGATQTYGMQLADRVNAQVQLVCYGGRGLTRTWQGDTKAINAPEFYDYAVPTDKQPLVWDQSLYHPDLAIIALGTNDFSASAGQVPDKSAYVSAYLRFIKKIQRDHGIIPIIISDGPLLADDDEHRRKSTLQDYLRSVEQQSDNVHFIAAHLYPGDHCDFHPNSQQHQAMAEDLLPDVKKIMQW